MPLSSSVIEDKLKANYITLAEPSAALASYIPYSKAGDLLFVSGQLPIQDGKLQHYGKVGELVDLKTGQRAARCCAVNILSQINAACEGEWERIIKCVKLTGYVQCKSDFDSAHKIMDGASDLMVAVLGEEAGRHARAAIGVHSLPLGASVEVEAVFQMAPDTHVSYVTKKDEIF